MLNTLMLRFQEWLLRKVNLELSRTRQDLLKAQERIAKLEQWQEQMQGAIRTQAAPLKSLRNWDQRRRFLEMTDGGRIATKEQPNG